MHEDLGSIPAPKEEDKKRKGGNRRVYKEEEVKILVSKQRHLQTALVIWPSAPHQPGPRYDTDPELQAPGDNSTSFGVSRVICSRGLGVSKWELEKREDWAYLFHHYLFTINLHLPQSLFYLDHCSGGLEVW